jgi:aminoglycoside phosphotransferase (APT) family kinase protein
MSAADTAPVRPGEELSVAALSEYLKDKLESSADAMTVEQFPGGHSNLTYLVRASSREYVLRRAPLGPVAPKAHDMAREFAVLRAVHPVFAPAPKVFHLCEDPSVIGAVFFVMERRHGTILRASIPPEMAALPNYPARVSRGFADCLVQLHRVDIAEHGLTRLGKPEGFLERQLRGWADRWNRSRTEELPLMEKLVAWLAARLPVSQKPTLVHNDYKLDNVMIDAVDPGRIEAVLDWEMSTIGDPLVDLGVTLCYWAPPTPLGAVACVSEGPGWYTADHLIEHYARGTGFDVSQVAYYRIFALFKLAVVIQQIYYRFHVGQTRDERFRDFGVRVKAMAETAWEMASRTA